MASTFRWIGNDGAFDLYGSRADGSHLALTFTSGWDQITQVTPRAVDVTVRATVNFGPDGSGGRVDVDADLFLALNLVDGSYPTCRQPY